MTDKELKKLSRRELLEMLIVQTKKVEMLEKKLSQVTEELNNKNINLKDAGNLADAVLKLNGVFEAAVKASEQYVENIKIMEEETKAECERLLFEAKAQAKEITDKALQTQ